ncbi:MAG: hypothetical protein ACFCU6_06200 [Balneolaceae bacterium]
MTVKRHAEITAKRRARRWPVYVVTIVFFIALSALITGQSWLEEPFFIFAIPIGNLLAWVMIFSLSFSIWLILRKTAFRTIASFLLIPPALWLPVSILLAGNVYLNNFSGWYYITWLVYTGLCILLPFLLIITVIMIRLNRQFHT